jgi:hypothetical protein
MNTHADKIQKNKSLSVANAVSQKQSGGESEFQFVDNRPEAIAQRKLQEMASNSPQVLQLKAFQKTANIKKQSLSIQNDSVTNPIQRMVSVDLLIDDEDKKKIRAEGKVKDFQGGTSAGSYGWLGVTSYRSSYKISDGTYVDSGEVGALKNDFTNPEAGHVLAKQNGGDGSDTWNIFAQDGGTNNGKYKSFENDMRKDLNKYEDNDNVKFTSYLAGTDIEDSGKIVNAGQSDAESISSEDSDY